MNLTNRHYSEWCLPLCVMQVLEFWPGSRSNCNVSVRHRGRLAKIQALTQQGWLEPESVRFSPCPRWCGHAGPWAIPGTRNGVHCVCGMSFKPSRQLVLECPITRSRDTFCLLHAWLEEISQESHRTKLAFTPNPTLLHKWVLQGFLHFRSHGELGMAHHASPWALPLPLQNHGSEVSKSPGNGLEWLVACFVLFRWNGGRVLLVLGREDGRRLFSSS